MRFLHHLADYFAFSVSSGALKLVHG